MLQIKMFSGLNIESDINEFLKGIDEDSLIGMTWNELQTQAVLQYKLKEAWDGMMCGDCKYWDDGGSTSAVSGICHECGGRRRFNSRACKCFKDVRGERK